MVINETVRKQMTEFCVREATNASDPRVAYISALTSVAHLCDQVARESKRKAERDAAKACGDFVWEVANAVKSKRSK